MSTRDSSPLYSILRHVGHSGEFDVYLAEDPRHGHRVVLRMLPDELVHDTSALARFSAEVYGSLRSPAGERIEHHLELVNGKLCLVLETENAEDVLPELSALERRILSSLATRGSSRATSAPVPTVPSDSLETESLKLHARSILSAGQILGSRYRIVRQLGSGGMGEVWLAFDVKLQVEVALKSLRKDRLDGERALELLRSEVRSAREVISPNVCRIFDLVVEDGQEFVSMEYIDGQTLLELVESRGPLDLRESRAIASQFLAGLEAIHTAGFVHRDIKPENIMITRAGRVVVMDFGIAKGIAAASSGTIAGTPAYMAPEQMRGEKLDARADIFAAGLVLAEMTSANDGRDREERERIWKGVRATPPRLPEGPWRAVLERAVAGERERRHPSASALARALEEVTLRVEGTDDKNPYPGLSSFTAKDAEFFFGREAEVEAVWKKLQRTHVLAVIGASGAGKTSFLQAGVVPAMPQGWDTALCHPGRSPVAALARELVSKVAGDTEAIRRLVQIESTDDLLNAIKLWRSRHDEALLVVDQFEELFTLNTPEVQAEFAGLLGRVSTEADVHVLLSMRDDFLIHCHAYPALGPVFSELTPLTAPAGEALRRALVQPALACGYRFEDESLVEEMLIQVQEERGALPLLAFAVSRLWEDRDRKLGLLRRETYTRLGGVGGALSQHAEATLERIGAERQSIAREMFRNLVTSQGTRVARDVDELLSVFLEGSEREAAAEVLRELVDARLLTSFEVESQGDEKQPTNRVEIIHESLITAWPRLVRWRTQEADRAQLRDQLRQAAQLWDERSRSDDMLWTGTAYREFQLWREQYPGGLTATEEAYARAMTHKTERQRKRRRRMVTATFASLCAVLAVVAALWIKAIAEARKAEARELYAQAQLQIKHFPSPALAYTIASLELEDDPKTRSLALEALWKGPTALVIRAQPPLEPGRTADFNRDGGKLAVGFNSSIRIFPQSGGAAVRLAPVDDSRVSGTGSPRFLSNALGEDEVLMGFHVAREKKIRFWSTTDSTSAGELRLEGSPTTDVSIGGNFLTTVSWPNAYPLGRPDLDYRHAWIHVWDIKEREPRLAGQREFHDMRMADMSSSSFASVDPTGTWLVYVKDRNLELLPIAEMEHGRPSVIGEHDDKIRGLAVHPTGSVVAAIDDTGEIRLWSFESPGPNQRGTLLRRMKGRENPIGPGFDHAGRWIATSFGDGRVQLWDLEGPPSQDPLELRWNRTQVTGLAFHPEGTWVAAAGGADPTLYPLAREYPRTLRGCSYGFHSDGANPAFAPDGSWLAIVCGSEVRLWSLVPSLADRSFPAFETEFRWGVAVDPEARYLFVWGANGCRLIDLPGGNLRELPSPGLALSGAIGPRGRFVATGHWDDINNVNHVIVVHDLESGATRELGPQEASVGDLQFTPEGDLYSVTTEGKLRRWDLETGTSELLFENVSRFELAPDGSRLLVIRRGDGFLHDLQTGDSKQLVTHGDRVRRVAFDPTGEIALTGHQSGAVRVHLKPGNEPHLLVAHKGPVFGLAVDPSARWIASTAEEEDPVLQLWPMPQGEPLHALPRREFLERLKALTNLRVVRDSTSTAGYRVDIGSFPGWSEVPTW